MLVQCRVDWGRGGGGLPRHSSKTTIFPMLGLDHRCGVLKDVRIGMTGYQSINNL